MAGLKPLFGWRSAICQSDLPPTTRHVLLTLSLYMSQLGDGCFPTHKQLIADTGLGRSTLIRHLARAEKDGWLLKCRSGKQGSSYRTLYSAQVPQNKKGLSPRPSRSDTPKVSLRDPLPIEYLSNNSPGEDDALFERWWEFSKLNTKGWVAAKKDARKAFTKALEHPELKGDVEKLCKRTAWYWETAVESGFTEARYVKRPPAWLRGEFFSREELDALWDKVEAWKETKRASRA